jgi:hypothetical protein
MGLSRSRLKSLRKFLARPPRERRLFLRVFALVAYVRILLWIYPFQVVRGRVQRLGSRRDRAAVPSALIEWAVPSAARFVPEATCLTQALAATALLEQGGQTAQLKFGVRRARDKSLEAHAWVECDGKIVVGGHDLQHLIELPVPGGDRA